MVDHRAILFTAFEPSGDAIAGSLISALRHRGVEQPIYALGGPQMACGGAKLIETTTENAVMLADAVGQALDHQRRVNRLRQWIRRHELAAVVVTDSPAANWSVCRLVRRLQRGAKIVHLVAPQLWAWAPWRVRKLRRLTDHVLCLWPFEPGWFDARGVKATFVGHPMFDRSGGVAPATTEGLPVTTGPRVALLPGSRASEIKRNWPMMQLAYERLAARHPGLTGLAALRDQADKQRLESWRRSGRQSCPVLPRAVAGRTADVLSWADAALVVSGTVTLEAAAHGTPMVVVYNVSRWSWRLVGWWLVNTRTFSLPNLIGESMGLGRVVPELVPHFGAVEPVAAALEPLLTDGPARRNQRTGLSAITGRFAARPFGEAAAAALLETIAQRPPSAFPSVGPLGPDN